MRCAVARRLETAPDGLRRALDDVEAASREVTDGLRRMLAVLRDDRTPPTPGAVTTSAPPAGAGGNSRCSFFNNSYSFYFKECCI